MFGWFRYVFDRFGPFGVHVKQSEIHDEEDAWLKRGNELADLWAKRGAAL